MIDVLDATERLTFAEVADRLPPDRHGRKVGPSTLARYATTGKDGRRLEAAKVGRTWFTTQAAVNAFYAAAPPARSPAPIPAPTPASKAEAKRRATVARRVAQLLA